MRLFFSLIFLGLLVSCGVIPDYRSPAPEIISPQAWNSAGNHADTEPQPWLAQFESPQLNALINEALRHNYDLKAAAARVSMARAMARINGAERLPQFSAGVKGSRSQRNSTSGFSISNPRSNSFGVDFTLSWELDVWGKLQNRSEAAEYDFAAAELDYKAARLSLAAGVASSWFKVIEASQQLQLAEKKVRTFTETVEIIHDGYVSGIFSALDLRLARANVAAAKSQKDAGRIDLDLAVRSLEILLGRYPDAGLIVEYQLPKLKQGLTTGLPSTLLQRRPDIVTAEKKLIAADQRFTAAWKNLLPSISFSASGGTNAAQLADILNYNTLIWNILGNLTQPVFQGGRLIAEKDQADAQTLEAAANYAQTILQAYFEVETALTAERLLNTQQQALQIATEESMEAEQLALDEYSSGLVEMITLLEAQRRSYDAQSALLQISSQRLLNRIALYLALGGDLKSESIMLEPENKSFFFSLLN